MSTTSQGPTIAELRREVGRLRAELRDHVRSHQEADELRARQAEERARLRRSNRRFAISIIATVIGSNLATILVLIK